MRRKRDYTPLSWEEYFESSKDVCVNDKNVSFLTLCAFSRKKKQSAWEIGKEYQM